MNNPFVTADEAASIAGAARLVWDRTVPCREIGDDGEDHQLAARVEMAVRGAANSAAGFSVDVTSVLVITHGDLFNAFCPPLCVQAHYLCSPPASSSAHPPPLHVHLCSPHKDLPRIDGFPHPVTFLSCASGACDSVVLADACHGSLS